MPPRIPKRIHQLDTTNIDLLSTDRIPVDVYNGDGTWSTFQKSGQQFINTILAQLPEIPDSGDVSGQIPLFFVDLATTIALPSVIYSNGVSGVGATLTSSSNLVLPLIDNIAAAVGETILIKNQVNKIHNGIYEVTDLGSNITPFILTRVDFNDETTEIYPSQVNVQYGLQNTNKYFLQKTENPIVGVNIIEYKLAPNPVSVPVPVLFADTVTENILPNNPVYTSTTTITGVPGYRAKLTATTNGVFPTLNNVGSTLNMRVLVNNQANLNENGYYILINKGSSTTKWILQRADAWSVNIYPKLIYMHKSTCTKHKSFYTSLFPISNAQVGTNPISYEEIDTNEYFEITNNRIIPKQIFDNDIAVRDNKGFVIETVVEINNNVELELSNTGQLYNIHHSVNKFYIVGSDTIFITDEQLNVLNTIDYNNSYVQGIRISAINEIGNKIYFATDNTPGALYVLDLTTEELKFRGYGSPEGILFNASYMPGPSGWADLSDIYDRGYTSFPGALDYTPPNSVGEEMVMWDTINNKYYTILFSVWQSGGAGGAISYVRREILSLNPTVLGPTVSFAKPNFGTQIDIIEGNAQLTRGNNRGLYNPAFESVNKDSYFWDINYNPVNNKVYTYDYEQGKILVMTDDLILESTITPVANVNPWQTAYSMGINTTNGDVYIVDNYGTVLVYDITNTKVADIDPATSFDNNGEDLLVYNSNNDTMYISDRTNTVYLFDGTTRALLGDLDIAPYVLNGISAFNSISFSDGEILLSGLDNSSNGLIVKIDNTNSITVLGNTELNRNLTGKSVKNTIKVNSQYAYVYQDQFINGWHYSSFIEINPPTIVQYDNKIIGGLATNNRTHQLQDSDGIVAHLSDIPAPGITGVYVNRTVYVDALYGNDSTGSIDRIDLPFADIKVAFNALYPVLSGANKGVVHVRSGIYSNTNVIFLQAGKFVDFYFESGADVRNHAFTDAAQLGPVECNILGFANFLTNTWSGYSLLEFGYHNSKVSLKCNSIYHDYSVGGFGVFGIQSTYPTYATLNQVFVNVEVDTLTYYNPSVSGNAFNIRGGSNFNLKAKKVYLNSSSINFRHRSSWNYPAKYTVNVLIDELFLTTGQDVSAWSSNIFEIENTSADSVFNYSIGRTIIDSQNSPAYAWLSPISLLGTCGTVNYKGDILIKGSAGQNGVIIMLDSIDNGYTYASFEGKVKCTNSPLGNVASLFINSLRSSELTIKGQVSNVTSSTSAQSPLLLVNNQAKVSFINFVSETRAANGIDPIIKVNDNASLIIYNSMFLDGNADKLVITDNTVDYIYLGYVICNRPFGNTALLDSSLVLFTQDAKLEKVPQINI